MRDIKESNMNYVANTWFLLVLFVLFVGLVFWVFRRDSSGIVLYYNKLSFYDFAFYCRRKTWKLHQKHWSMA